MFHSVASMEGKIMKRAIIIALMMLLLPVTRQNRADEAVYDERREQMVASTIENRGIRDTNVLKAMRAAPVERTRSRRR
jgi:hypothetical protein